MVSGRSWEISHDATAVIIAAERVRSGRVLNSFHKGETTGWIGCGWLGKKREG